MKQDMKIIRYFEGIETVQEYDGYYYSVEEVVVIIVLGLLCGLKNVRQIHQWATNEHVAQFLRNKIVIQKIPCYYWMHCLLALVKPESLNQCFMHWVASMLPEGRNGFTLSLDGKTIRSTTKSGSKKQPLHIISAQIAELQVTLAQKTVSDKNNEIPAVQELLGELNIKGCMVVADALHCQKETARIIVENKADYLLNAKKNQRRLQEELSDYVQDNELRKGMDTAYTLEKSRDRVERRTAWCTHDTGWMSSKEEWVGLKSIGAIRTQFSRNGVTSDEWHYYISSRKLTAEELLSYARKEWSVETMHWLLDVHWREDFCRALNRYAQQSLNILRKTALNLMRRRKQRTGSKQAFTGMMLDCLMNCDLLLDVLSEA